MNAREIGYTIVEIGVVSLLLFGIVTFIWEIYEYQLVYLPTVWAGLSVEEQSLININLSLMDLKIIFSIGLMLYWCFKMSEGEKNHALQ